MASDDWRDEKGNRLVFGTATKKDYNTWNWSAWYKLKDRFNLIQMNLVNNVIEFKGDNIHGYYSLPSKTIRLKGQKEWYTAGVKFFKKYYDAVNKTKD